MVRIRLLVAVLSLSLLAIGCGGTGEHAAPTVTPTFTATPLLDTPPPTPTPSSTPIPTATLAAGQCRNDGNSGDCGSLSELCLPPDGFAGCGICYSDDMIDQSYRRCSADTDCGELGDGFVCRPLGLDTHTCDPCSGNVSVCMLGCSADEQCDAAQVCKQHRCVGLPCTNDGDCPMLYSCGPSADGPSRCSRRACQSDLDCPGGFCVEGACYSELGRCMPIPA